MKTKNIIAAIVLLFGSFSCQGQTKDATLQGQEVTISTSDEYSHGLILYDSAPFDFYIAVSVNDSTQTKFKPEQLTIEGDTVKAFLYMWEKFEEKQYEVEALRDILSYINIYGHVPPDDFKEFQEAVKSYKQKYENQ